MVPTDTPGFEATRVPCRGLGKLMPTNAVSMTDVRVPADAVLGEVGGGFKVAMNALDYGRLTVAARSVGLAQACLDAALSYADARTAFGEKIGTFQMVKKQLADMTVEVAAARALVRAAAERYDVGDLATRGELGRQVLRGGGLQPGRPGRGGDLRRGRRSATTCRSGCTSTTRSCGRPVRGRPTSRPT
ncbi:acyl-CoA dehydrogenase family protein [Nocardioides sp. TF02-7]|uniref:acyl-CoA dehydrogenase family protein n=1 Tax=Nocardioides sp. TF02-7 TaxID=2917724 RepID=UPI001F050A51|nr:acyl-CoA dehydrogenase family protein [Nocardioides sp. TF02-7]UMG91215.1 hypothetical protein MF408_13605 [Nocardioides sp. TF02-7]